MLCMFVAFCAIAFYMDVKHLDVRAHHGSNHSPLVAVM
jgi:hypothetical protein